MKRLKRIVVLVSAAGLMAGCGFPLPSIDAPVTPSERYAAVTEDLKKATTDLDRFFHLCEAAKQSFELGKTEKARAYAQEQLKLIKKFSDDWIHGNAVHDANMVLGRIAVKEGRIEDAKSHLLAAGKTPGSPQLNSFGPNMSLARDLLLKNEREVVLEYFALCGKFWDMDKGRLIRWSQQVKDGKMPIFGANLMY